MPTAAENRRANLDRLVQEFGSLEAVATLGQTSPIYLSQIRNSSLDSKTGRPRQMGSGVARRLEKKAGKPEGWMDADHIGGAQPATLQPTLAAALPIVLDALAAAPARAELRQLLPMLIDTDAPAYRQRLAELLTPAAETAATPARVDPDHQTEVDREVQIAEERRAHEIESQQRRRASHR